MKTSLFAAAVLFGFVASAHAAGFDCSKWEKNADGSWSAKEAVEIGGNAGRLDYVPGEKLSIDLTEQSRKNPLPGSARQAQKICARPRPQDLTRRRLA